MKFIIQYITLLLIIFYSAVFIHNNETYATENNIETETGTVKSEKLSQKIRGVNSSSGGNFSFFSFSGFLNEKINPVSINQKGKSFSFDSYIEAFFTRLVIETSKSEFRKKIRELNVTFKKEYPDDADRIKAFKMVYSTFENIQYKLNNEELNDFGMNKKQEEIYRESLTYLLSLIEDQIELLEN